VGAGQIPREVIEAVRERADIAQVVSMTVTLQRKGSALMGLCPFHTEKSPSFSVVPSKGIYHCFGCGEGGDVFAFLQKTRGISFFEAVKELGELVGVQVEDRELDPAERARLRSRAGLIEVLEAAQAHFHSNLVARPEGAAARAYLQARGVTDAVIQRWKLGFALDSWDGLLNALHREGFEPQQLLAAGLARRRERGGGMYDLFRGRVIIPIEDARGRVVAFGGRVLPDAPPDAPKYVNSPETEVYKKSHTLFGLPRARAAVQRKEHLLVVEGYFDVISLHTAGIEEAVATCGTSLTTEHARLLKPLTRKVIAQFDGDEAGQRAAVRSLEIFAAAGIEARMLHLGEAKDPDEFIQTRGKEAFEGLLRQSQPVFELAIDRAVRRHGLSPAGVAEVLRELSPVVRLFDGAMRRLAVQRLCQRLHVREDLVEEQVGRPPAPVGVSAPPPRWVGTKELNHLMWLVIHHREAVQAPLAAVEPALISDRPSVLRAIGLLLQGADVPAVLEAVASDPDLVQILRRLTAVSGLFQKGQAEGACRQILSGLQGAAVAEELERLGAQLRSTPPSDWKAYQTLLQQKAALQKRRAELQKNRLSSAPTAGGPTG